ncbi:MAG: cysteine desulfurase family protein [Bacillota bacterium]|jgi:cysteine desulfurase
MQEIYFDNSATTKVDGAAADLAYRVMTEAYGNPSSLHKKGMEAYKILKTARRQTAAPLGAEEEEIIFTSGGTEADNLALQGIAGAYGKRGKHIITTAVEHPAILNTCKKLEEKGFEVTVLPVDGEGLISLRDLRAAIRKDTVLVSMMLVNNEVGSIMPVRETAKILQKQQRKIFLHVDAVQAFGKMSIKPKLLGIDLLSASGHKIQAPKGVGFLYAAKGVRLIPLFGGGGQEDNLRSGTENLPAIAGLGLAAEKAMKNLNENYEQVQTVRQTFLEGLRDLPDWRVHGAAEGLPHVLNIGFEGVKSEVLLHTLETEGLYVSSGSACAAKKDALSPVLSAMGLSREEIEGSLRFSFSSVNTKEEAERAAEITLKAVTELRKILK